MAGGFPPRFTVPGLTYVVLWIVLNGVLCIFARRGGDPLLLGMIIALAIHISRSVATGVFAVGLVIYILIVRCQFWWVRWLGCAYDSTRALSTLCLGGYPAFSAW